MARSNSRPLVAPPKAIDADFEEVDDASALVMSGARTAMRMQTQYATALSVQRPRDLSRVQAMVLREAELTGSDFLYSMTFKTKDGPTIVEGTSIDGAMILARNWMNCASDVELIVDAPVHWIFRASFIDLETGFTETRLFRQRKSERHMKGDDERGLDAAFQIGQSKSKRNSIVRAMPTWLVTAAIAAAKKGAEDKVNVALPREIDSVVNAFAKIGVTEEMLARRVGAPRAQWVARDVVQLRAIGLAIRDRQTTAKQEFYPDAEEGSETTDKGGPAQPSTTAAATTGAPEPSSEAGPREREPGEEG